MHSGFSRRPRWQHTAPTSGSQRGKKGSGADGGDPDLAALRAAWESPPVATGPPGLRGLTPCALCGQKFSLRSLPHHMRKCTGRARSPPSRPRSCLGLFSDPYAEEEDVLDLPLTEAQIAVQQRVEARAARKAKELEAFKSRGLFSEGERVTSAMPSAREASSGSWGPLGGRPWGFASLRGASSRGASQWDNMWSEWAPHWEDSAAFDEAEFEAEFEAAFGSSSSYSHKPPPAHARTPFGAKKPAPRRQGFVPPKPKPAPSGPPPKPRREPPPRTPSSAAPPRPSPSRSAAELVGRGAAIMAKWETLMGNPPATPLPFADLPKLEWDPSQRLQLHHLGIEAGGDKKAGLKRAMLAFHPDKVQQRLGHALAPDPKIPAYIKAVAQAVLELRKREL